MGEEDLVIFGDEENPVNLYSTLNETILELMEYQDDDEVTRIIIETLAEIKTWQHRQNPHTPLRHIVLNRNLYNRVVQFTDF